MYKDKWVPLQTVRKSGVVQQFVPSALRAEARDTASQPCALLITSLLEVAAFTGIFFPLNGAPDQYSNGIVVAMSFGFSLGDFFAVGQLAWNVYKSCTRFTPKRPLMVTN